MKSRVRRLSVWTVMALAGWSLLALAPRSGAQGEGGTVAYAEFETSVNPGSADFLIRLMEDAKKRGDQALLIRLDTPGGMVESTREIVKAQLASTVPILVWVGPSGSRAGSAGVFITIASHVAAMAPATNIGAAHPVTVGGGGGGDKEKEGAQDKIMEEKITNDMVAWAKGIATQRGRNGDWVSDAIRKSVSVPAEEALKLKVIDLIAPDVPALLKAVDGRTVKTASGEVKLATAQAQLRNVDMTLRERVLDALGDPTIAYLLLSLGVMGLLAEFFVSGATIVPGILGAVCLAIGLVATRMLPVRAGAVMLVIVGAAFIAAEFFVTSWGLLAVGGVICFALGGLLLVNPSDPDYLVDPDFGVNWTAVMPVLLIVGGTVLLVAWKVVASRVRKPITGLDGMAGEEGSVELDVGPTQGKVLVHGELWEARSAVPIAKGQRVRVVAVKGLLATVEPVSTGPVAPGS